MNVPVDVTGVVLYTPRLVLRPFGEKDLDDLFAYSSVDGVGQMAGWQPHKTKEDSRSVLEMFMREKKVLAIEFRSKVIGSVGIEQYDEAFFPELSQKRFREIGFALSKTYWGMGLMPEAVREVIRWCFEAQRLDGLLCGHFTWNHQSQRVQQKCGFHPYKPAEFAAASGKPEKGMMNILLREEWVK